jgi:hypothetical protein
MEKREIRIPGQPLHTRGGRGRDTGIGLQKRQNAHVAKQAAVVIREVGCVGIGQRGKLGIRRSAE